MPRTKNVLAVVPPHMGGRKAGAGLATLLPDGVDVTVVPASRPVMWSVEPVRDLRGAW
ncbi:hypothetical protein [Streptomyces prunicolor]|uniref:hypothetical protein n=1 Tax=Streptomyces prunicolor TaxID=67348 RepID=UPI003448AFF7